MTLAEFEELALTVLALASPTGDPSSLDECHRAALVATLLGQYTVRMPSDVAAYKDAVTQQREVTDAVKMAAAAGRLQTHFGGEPS